MRQLTITVTGQAAGAACDHILIFERGKYFFTALPGAIFVEVLPGSGPVKTKCRYSAAKLNEKTTNSGLRRESVALA